MCVCVHESVLKCGRVIWVLCVWTCWLFCTCICVRLSAHMCLEKWVFVCGSLSLCLCVCMCFAHSKPIFIHPAISKVVHLLVGRFRQGQDERVEKLMFSGDSLCVLLKLHLSCWLCMSSCSGSVSASCSVSPPGGIGPPGLLQHIVLLILVSWALHSLHEHTVNEFWITSSCSFFANTVWFFLFSLLHLTFLRTSVVRVLVHSKYSASSHIFWHLLCRILITHVIEDFPIRNHWNSRAPASCWQTVDGAVQFYEMSLQHLMHLICLYDLDGFGVHKWVSAEWWS